jgi:rfaE bifunctional protein kinase chain/domain
VNVRRILQEIANLNVLVVGDICLDRWCYYDPQEAEPSRETGIPRVAVVRTDVTPGAGGTIANNLAALGVRNIGVAGIVGDDGFGYELRRALSDRGIGHELLVNVPEFCTFTYTKLINTATGHEDRPRVDFINARPMPDPLLDRIDDVYDVVVVSDQAETATGGVVTPALRERLMTLRRGIVWVDSRKRPELFRGVVLKPNRDEAFEACQRVYGAWEPQRLFADNQLRALIVTHGDAGAQVFTDKGEEWAHTRKVNAVDICGAGDSFSAGAACAFAVTGSALEAAEFGNLVASITVTKTGTGTASPEELLAL